MENHSTQSTSWFKQKIIELYGNPEIKKVSTPSKIEWQEVEEPYTTYEEQIISVDDGMKSWVLLVALPVIFVGLVIILFNFIVLGIILIASGAIFGFIGNKKFRDIRNETKKIKKNKIRINKIRKEIPQYKNEVTPNEWALKRFGVGSLKFGVAKINQCSLLTGIDFSKNSHEFLYPVINKEKGFIDNFKNLEKELENTPFILNGDKENFDCFDENNVQIDVSLCGLEKDIMNHFIDTEYVFANNLNKKVSATLFKEGNYKEYLLKTNEPFQFYEDELLSLINDGQELDETCDNWLNKWHNWKMLLQESRIESVTEQVTPEFMKYGNHSHYGSFNFYCPDCNDKLADELLNRDYSVHSSDNLAPIRYSKNTRCNYLMESNSWQCQMCSIITFSPIPIHKALDEILFPVYDNLMEENKTEREKDYSDVRKKEIHYKNEMKKELEKMYFENLSGILELKDDMLKMRAEIDGESEAIQFINESIIKYKNLQSEIINSIEASNVELKSRIQATAQKILHDVDRIKDREMELLNVELDELSKAKRLDDERRDSIQVGILSASQEQNNILNSKFNELISTNNTGFSNVASEVNKGSNLVADQVSSNILKASDTNRKALENVINSSKDVGKELKLNNAMSAARNEKMGIDSYDDSTILHPGRAIKRGLVNIGNSITGKSSVESHLRKLKTVNK